MLPSSPGEIGIHRLTQFLTWDDLFGIDGSKNRWRHLDSLGAVRAAFEIALKECSAVENAAKSKAMKAVVREEPMLSHDDEDRRIGAWIRQCRKERNLSIEQLAKQSGLSVGMLSQLERGLSTPTVRSLRVLGVALDVPISWFFSRSNENDDDSDFIVRIGSRRDLTLTPSGVYKQLLTPDRPGVIELYELSLKPGGTSGTEFYSHRGEKSGVILSGRLRLWIDNRSHVLNEGDSFRFPSDKPHRFENPGSNTTRLIWVVVGQI
jgi:transcriptional regulator with XRE-family HTH domain